MTVLWSRKPGFVQEQEHEDEEYREHLQHDKEVFLQAKRAADSKSGRLVNWQDAVKSQKASCLDVSLLPPLSRLTGHLIVPSRRSSVRLALRARLHGGRNQAQVQKVMTSMQERRRGN